MLIGISGGIGSGKSVVSRVLRLKGYPVYDCDSEARRIMAENCEIKRRICDEISREVTDGIRTPDRKRLAEIVFNDENARLRLNDIVHEAVRNDLLGKVESYPIVWVEAAILAESGIAGMCDRIWRVETPMDDRIENIIRRDDCSRQQAEARIRAQQKEDRLISQYEEKMDILRNDMSDSILRQVSDLISSPELKKKSYLQKDS
ncbi:MAG: dephospho-CoA kinase [Muribaculaceae bacterium]|nr:dephospho-CoA kinase [Muribaculaceae bacterium]